MSTTPLDQIKKCLRDKNSFLLEAGAGSGKTWHLMESAQYLVDEYGTELRSKNQKIMCITFTNVATNEITERVDGNPLVKALTYHKFLWQVISQFQEPLKLAMTKTEHGSNIENLLEKLKGKKVEYSEHVRDYENGKLWYDDILKISEILFADHPKLSRIVASKYPFIFIDEYQDTEKQVINLLLDSILKNYQGIITLGFFGDSMQAIYGRGVGKLENDNLIPIELTGNYRCSKAVIHFLNHIRPELKQDPRGDNMKGSVRFINRQNLESVKAQLETEGWNFDPSITKVLLLTHRAIANQAGNLGLFEVYNTRYRAKTTDLLFNKQDPYSEFLFNKIEPLVKAFEGNMFNKVFELLGKERVPLQEHADKAKLKKKLNELLSTRSYDVATVLKYIYNSGLFPKSPRIKDFESDLSDSDHEHHERHQTFYNELMQVDYSEVVTTYKYIEENTPFSTQHNTKGAEYENVLLVLDDAVAKKWHLYNFSEYISGVKQSSDRHERTRKLFYVCCSRAINNLVILAPDGLVNKAALTLDSWITPTKCREST